MPFGDLIQCRTKPVYIPLSIFNFILSQRNVNAVSVENDGLKTRLKPIQYVIIIQILMKFVINNPFQKFGYFTGRIDTGR